MNSVAFSRRPLFWFILSCIFIFGSSMAIKYFARVFPIINIDITMNRSEALRAARELATTYKWGPDLYQQAALFDDDDETQNFIELEGGGKKVFAQILQEKYFSPYTWQVRHFKQNEPNETLIEFTPEGKPYGFEEKLSEDTPGASLTQEQARAIAVGQAKQQWNTNFSFFELIESSQETKNSGRIDHTFVYERTDKKVGGAPYRLKLVVSGDKLTTYDLSIKVPEAFKRRFEQMRSANNTIARTAGIAMILLYIVGGSIIGLFFLLRRRWLQWRTPLLWASGIAFLQFLNGINSLPMYWMRYDTQLTKITFLSTFFLSLAMQFFGYLGIFTLIFMAAESLGRKAFPNHLQLWRLWSQKGASTIQTLGRTIGGYLIIGFDFSYLICFYYIAFRYFGWWAPSETLINPNVLSYYVPWLASVSQALEAGFMEECLFRAIPLSCAMLIGKKRGNKKVWLIIGMLIQAIIFSAAHASYPAQPAFARLVELLVPSMVFGILYLVYGLLPAIISHFVYDVILMALPLFLSTAPGIWIDKIVVVFCSLIPLLIVLHARFFFGKWTEMSPQLYNHAWQPAPYEPLTKKTKERKQKTMPKKIYTILFASGIAALCIWAGLTRFNQDGFPILISQKQATDKAHQMFKDRNIILGPNWHIIPSLEPSVVQDVDRFVWQTAGKDVYKQLLGTYLIPARWKIRFAQFGPEDIVERAEEYVVYINPNGTPIRFDHQLPESRVGKILSESQVRAIAHEVLQNEYHLNPANLKEISAVSTKQPQRLDWVFTFQDPAAYPQQESAIRQGQARIAIEITGNQVSDHYRFVYAPEQWTRSDKQHQAILKILALLCTLLLSLFLLIGIARSIVQWSQHEFAIKPFILVLSIMILKSLFQIINLWPSLIADFKTSEPFWHQTMTLLGTFAMQILFKATAYGLLVGFIVDAHFHHVSKISRSKRLMSGISLGALLAAFEALCTKISPTLKPVWAEYTHAVAYLPSISYALTLFSTYLYTAILFYMIFWTVDMLSQGWRINKLISCIIFAFAGIALHGSEGIDHILSWIGCGLVIGTLMASMYIFIIRFDRSIIPLMIGTFISFDALQQGMFAAFPGATLGAVMSIVLIIIFSYWWTQFLATQDHHEYTQGTKE